MAMDEKSNASSAPDLVLVQQAFAIYREMTTDPRGAESDWNQAPASIKNRFLRYAMASNEAGGYVAYADGLKASEKAANADDISSMTAALLARLHGCSFREATQMLANPDSTGVALAKSLARAAIDHIPYLSVRTEVEVETTRGADRAPPTDDTEFRVRALGRALELYCGRGNLPDVIRAAQVFAIYEQTGMDYSSANFDKPMSALDGRLA